MEILGSVGNTGSIGSMGTVGSVGNVGQAWRAAATALGGDAASAESSGAHLDAAYGSDRSYHDAAHIEQVLTDSSWLADHLGCRPLDRAVIAAAACAHDVVYTGAAGDDEAASAAWARRALAAAGVAGQLCERIAELITATAEHVARPDDDVAWVLLDADLAILGQEPQAYMSYVRRVRQEYQTVSEPDWITGRSAVLRALRDRGSIFHLPEAQARWEMQAQRNIADELASLGAAGSQGGAPGS